MTEPGNDNMAYFAGLLDADGNIYQKRNQGRIYPEINIANGDQKILDWLASRFGGHIQPLRNHYKDSYNRRPRFRWVLNKGQEVKDVLRRCEPYLIAKRERAAEAIVTIEERQGRKAKLNHSEPSREPPVP